MTFWNTKRSKSGTNVFLDSVKGNSIRSNPILNKKISADKIKMAKEGRHGWQSIISRAKVNFGAMSTRYNKNGTKSLVLYESNLQSDKYYHIGVTSLKNPKDRIKDERSCYKLSELNPLVTGNVNEILKLEFLLRIKFVTKDMVKDCHYYEWYLKSDKDSIMNFINEFILSSETIRKGVGGNPSKD